MTNKEVYNWPKQELKASYMFPRGTTWTAPWYKIRLAKLFGKKIVHFSSDGEICGYFWRGVFYMTEYTSPPKIRGYEVTDLWIDDEVNTVVYKEDEPCHHPGCLSHVSHPCEGCGRISGKGLIKLPTSLVESWKKQSPKK